MMNDAMWMWFRWQFRVFAKPRAHIIVWREERLILIGIMGRCF